MVPVVFGEHGRDVARELRELRRGSHGLTEFAVNARIPFLVRPILFDRAAYTHDADDKGQFRRGEILAHIPDEVDQHLTVLGVAAGLCAVRVGAAVYHVVPALKPDETGQLIAFLGVVGRVDALDIAQHLVDMLHHQAVILAGLLGAIGLGLNEVLALFLEVLQLLGVELVGTGAGWTEIRVQRLAAPGGLDDEDRLIHVLLHVNAEGQLRPDLRITTRGAVPRGQSTMPFALRRRRIDRRNPHVLANLGRAVGVADRLEDWRGFWVHADVVERPYLGMALHVRLANKEVDLKRPAGRLHGRAANGKSAYHQKKDLSFHSVLFNCWYFIFILIQIIGITKRPSKKTDSLIS